MFLGLDFRHAETWAVFGVFVGGSMLFTTLVLEHVFALAPCYLCLSQRYCMFLGVLITSWGLMTEPRRGIFPLLTILSCLGGIAFVFRQFYLMYVPGATDSCSANLNYLLEGEYPFADVLAGFFQGSESCGEFSIIPFLSLIGYGVLIAIAIQQLRLGPRSSYK